MGINILTELSIKDWLIIGVFLYMIYKICDLSLEVMKLEAEKDDLESQLYDD